MGEISSSSVSQIKFTENKMGEPPTIKSKEKTVEQVVPQFVSAKEESVYESEIS